MATRLHDAGADLVAWNRSRPARERMRLRGARVAESAAEAIASADVVVMMLANGVVIDEVLGRTKHGFAIDLKGKIVVNMGTVAPSYSRALHDDLSAECVRFVEAPVSGSKAPAHSGELVAMLAGDPESLERVEELLGPLTSSVVRCGEVPLALETKLAVNTFLITMVTGLAEALAYGERRGVDLTLLSRILDAGPMASTVSRGKLAKLLDGDLTAQASIHDVRYNSRLILDAARQVSAAMPLLALAEELLAESEALGHGNADMITVIEAIRVRSDSAPHEGKARR